MASKKLKKALIAGLAGVAGAKMLGAANKAKMAASAVDTGDLGSEMANDTALAMGARKNMEAGIAAKKAAADSSMLGRAKKFLKEEIFTTNPKTKVSDMFRNRIKPNYSERNAGVGFDDYYGGLPAGAKTGKMIKAKNGVMARGCKLGRNKRTIIT